MDIEACEDSSRPLPFEYIFTTTEECDDEEGLTLVSGDDDDNDEVPNPISPGKSRNESCINTLHLSKLHISEEPPQENKHQHQKAKPRTSLIVPSSRKRRSSLVSFTSVEIRQYERILGDNPSCSCGAPLSIGWEYNSSKTSLQSVDDYEYRRNIRRDRDELIINKSERKNMLTELGYSRKEITEVIRSNLAAKKQRRQTANNIPFSNIEEKLEGASKRLLRMVRKRPGSKSLYRQWKSGFTTDAIDRSSSASSLKSSMKRTISTSDFISMVLDKSEQGVEVSNESRPSQNAATLDSTM